MDTSFWNAVCILWCKNADRCRSGSSAPSGLRKLGRRLSLPGSSLVLETCVFLRILGFIVVWCGSLIRVDNLTSIVFPAKVATMRCWSTGFESSRKALEPSRLRHLRDRSW